MEEIVVDLCKSIYLALNEIFRYDYFALLTIANITAENIQLHPYPIYWLIWNFEWNVTIDTFTVNKVSIFNEVLRMEAINTVQMSNAYIQNTSIFSGNLIAVYFALGINISNLTMTGLTGKNTYALAYIQTYNGGYASLDGYSISNSSLGGYNGFVLANDNSGNPSYLTMKNCQFNNITMLTSSSLIKSGVVKQLVVQNATFNYIVQKDLRDTTNKIFNFRGMDMNTTGQFSISSVSVQSSSVSLMNLVNIINSNISTVNTVSISDISYINSNLQSSDSLIALSSIEVNAALNISISNIFMSNITFLNNGVLMLFEQQTSVVVVVKNCLFENTVNASLHFEPYNKNNPTLVTNMKFVNMTVRNSSAYFKSFMEATTGAVISIYDSIFVNNCNFLSGSVVSADSQGTILSFYNSIFQNNTSVQGGVFYIENQGVIMISKSTVQSNFAIQSGVIQASNEGRYQINSSVISNNYAFSISVSEALLVASEPIIINNCTIYQNMVLTKNTILSEIQIWNMLWFMTSGFRAYISTNSDLMGSIFSEYSFQLISSSLIIENSTAIYSQDYFIDGFESQLQINNSVLRDSTSYSFIVSLSYSTFVSDNLILFNIFSKNSENSILGVLFASIVEISNIKYSSSNSTLLYTYQTQVSMDSVELSNMQLDGNLIYISKWTGVKLQNMSVTNITSIQSYILYFSDSSVDLISNTSITNTKKTGMLVSNTNITEVSTLTLKDVAHGVVVQSKSTISSLHNSSLTKVGSLDVSNGGALDIIDSAVSLSNSRFEQNQAQSGAAISVRCSNYDLWNK